MPFNLLLFPIIGGYYILIRSELFRYRQQRVETQKLILNSILAGIFLLAISWSLTSILKYTWPELVSKIVDFYPVKIKYFGTAVASFMLAVVITELTNLIVEQSKQISLAIRSIGNELERLCEYCYSHGELAQFTLKNDKCYVDWIQSLPIPSHDAYIRIFPVYSGYRHKDTRELVFTTQYIDVYEKLEKDENSDIEEKMTLVIRIDEIITANLFKPEIYQRFSIKTEEA